VIFRKPAVTGRDGTNVPVDFAGGLLQRPSHDVDDLNQTRWAATQADIKLVPRGRVPKAVSGPAQRRTKPRR